MFHWLARAIGRRLADFLNKPAGQYELFSPTDEEALRANLRPGDVLLVEGNRRTSIAIKYLTQSTWSHACLYIGNALENRPLPKMPSRNLKEGGMLQSKIGPIIEETRERSEAGAGKRRRRDGFTTEEAGRSAAPREAPEEPLELIEVDVVRGVIAVPLSKYTSFNTRICRPVGLTHEDTGRLLDFAIAQIGHQYDLKNIWDLVRYLLPEPPIPSRFRRRLLAFGTGDPTRAICSTFLAQAFQSIRYPILPRRGFQCEGDPAKVTDEEILRARHYSHFTPRDFDVSPYFAVVKPTIEKGFDYRKLKWQEEPTPPAPVEE